MGAGLANSISFDPADPRSSLGSLPEAPAIYALCAADPAAEPYLSKTPNLRRRLMRFLRAGDAQTRRLQLAHLVDHIEYTLTGSDFESSLCLYEASLRAFGERAKKRMRLRPPALLRMSTDNRFPRVYATAKVNKTAAHALFGPFPSRAAAERYAEEALNLFQLRRCFEELNPDPAFPGCVYSEMKMCLAPCFKGCTDERYAQEAADVFAFLSTRGASLLSKLETERNAASEAMEFEQAASIHQRMQKVQAVAHQAAEVVRPLAQLSGVMVQPSPELDHVSLFGLQRGVWSGPASYSIMGMRLANERSGSSSLFAHPMALEPVALGDAVVPAKDVLEARLDEALVKLRQKRTVAAATWADHLSLLAQWFYRPKSTGELLFTGVDGEVPRKPLLRAISRVAAKAVSATA